MQSPKIIAFLEGTMERSFANSNFKYVEVITIRNGDGWTVDALVTQIINLYRVRDPSNEEIVVWFDREGRQESSKDIETTVRAALITEGVAEERLHVVVCDQMTENLFLADEEMVRKKFGDENYSYASDGSSGKHIVKGIYQALNEKYRETDQGVELLKSMRLDRAALKSEFAERFRSGWQLTDCWWFLNPQA